MNIPSNMVSSIKFANFIFGPRNLHVIRMKNLYCFAENQLGYTKDSTWRANINGRAGRA